MTFILCADDFGLNSGVSQGILNLVRKRRLSAVSCMTNRPDFAVYAHELKDFKDKVQIGLHFNLTEGSFLSLPDTPCFSLNELLIKAHLHWLDTSFLAKEFTVQLDAFIETMGSLPDFIDGHQHVHQFPGIRQVILDVYEQRLRLNGTYIRSTYPAVSLKKYQFKTNILALTGGRVLHRALCKLAIPHNASFSGVYDFNKDVNYRALFRQWLAMIPDRTLIMCHPGEGEMLGDVIAPTRIIESEYFLSDDFLSDCGEFGKVFGAEVISQ